MIHEYRIKSINDKHWPQVRSKFLGIWGKWETIAEHPGESFGLYPENHTDYPKTENECRVIIGEYKQWLAAKKGKVKYTKVL